MEDAGRRQNWRISHLQPSDKSGLFSDHLTFTFTARIQYSMSIHPKSKHIGRDYFSAENWYKTFKTFIKSAQMSTICLDRSALILKM